MRSTPSRAVSGALSEMGHGAYSLTSMPIERAEPSTMRMAASMVSQFKSFIFFSAISLTCALVTAPAVSRPGVFEPLSSLAAFLMKYETGGVSHLEGEGTVLIDRDHHRDRRALLHVLGLGVELPCRTP